jgi:hypothetical protein
MAENRMNGTPEDEGIDPQQEHANGLRAYATLGTFLESDGWHPQALDDNHVYRLYFAGQNGEQACFAQVRVELEQFLFYCVMPVRVPENMRAAIAEYLTRANYGLRIGNFEMDFSDGEVRYKSSLDFEGESLTPNLIRNTIYPAVQTMDRYIPGMLAVIYGGKSPEEAIAEVEQSA